MKPVLLYALLLPLVLSLSEPAASADWRSKYSTGRTPNVFEACCIVRDCRTAEALGYPEMKKYEDGSYEVKIGKYWVRYDFPAVHESEDAKIWVCYLETNLDPEPLCLFLPPKVS